MPKPRVSPRVSRRAPGPAEGLFDPVELEILKRYFGLETRLERAQLLEDAKDLEEEDEERPGRAAAAFGVRLEEVSLDADHEDPALARAVARLCLHVVGRRPAARAGASPLDTLARAGDDQTPEQAPYDAPLLFTIDWAMLSWPESYFAVLVPGFDRYVVVKTSDEECIGGRWLALGWFERGQDAVTEVGRIIRGWWAFEAETSQERWETFLTKGRISKALANRWADAVWTEEEVEDEEEEEAGDEDGLGEGAEAEGSKAGG
ncbi:MAG: hypothetical protein IPQ24_02770 [Anaeromyxobacter sp.]|nr:hypothetical protein [Anaeromyxobacter sp.]